MSKKLPKGAIGYKKDFTDEELAGKHIDSITELVFETDEDYINHVSPETGFKPSDIEHQDALTNGEFSKVSEKALQRGEKKREETSEEK